MSLASLALPFTAKAQYGSTGPARVYYITNNLEGAVPEKPIREVTEPLVATEPSVGRIDVNTAERHQTMAGVGAAFSEIGTLAFAGLPADRQQVLLHALFNIKDGAGFSFCRLPVGANDFATSAYSYAETPDDYEMKDFSLARDEKSIIPAVLAARRVNPALQLFASPWSPPGWMKQSGKMDGGGGKNHENNRLRDEVPIYKAYALYFEKYLTGYLQHGIPIARLSPQNEMDCNPGYPGCVMEPAQTIKLVTEYLAPRFQASKVATEIWPGTFRESPKAPWATECMKNEAFRAVATGLGIQYYNGHLIEALAKDYPGLRFMHTEADCQNGKNTAQQARRRMGEMLGNFNSGCENYAYWNMLLDEKQKSGWGWAQNSLVTIDRTTHEIRYNPDYQPVCLVSRFVRPGDVRVTAAFHNANGVKFSTPIAAFVNARGETVILAQNQNDTPVTLDLNFNGTPGKISLPANADCAVVFPALTLLPLGQAHAETPAQPASPETFQPNWTSIAANYQVPEWYRDAKFGIFIHWGVYSVPAYHDEWYPRWMYKGDEGSRKRVFDYHIKTYGPQDKFGYKDFIPLFKAEKWDPVAWAKLFKDSGAQYIVPVAEHHDGFAMYDSALSPWTSVKMGPHRDIIGELRTAILAEGLHFGLSSHRAEHWWFFSGGRDFPSDVQDPRYASLYGPAQSNRKNLNNPEGKAFLDDWLARCNELVDKYQPELVYFDVVGSWSPEFQPYLQQFVAHYYNAAAQLNRRVAVNYKTGLMPDNTGVLDFERDVSDKARAQFWQTDTSVGKKSWSYINDEEFKSPKQLINEFVDVVSKNGTYLLNIGPRADGTIPDEPRDLLLAFGAWLKINGEAIYGSRPAAIAGEGPTQLQPKGPGRDKVESPYGSADFRFTRKGDVLYAIALGWPDSGAWTIHSLADQAGLLTHDAIKDVRLLGCPDKLEWKQTAAGLEVVAPHQHPCEHAYVFKITTASLLP